MPRKRRTVKLRSDTPLSTAIGYRLMTGAWAETRIAGWVAAAMLGADEAAHLAAVWSAHGDTLTAEAAAGFVPYAASRRRPSGPGYERWADHYLATHRY